MDSRGTRVAEHRLVGLDNGVAVTAAWYRAAGQAVATLVLGHGAGAGQFSDFMVGTAGGLADRHLDVVTFNFPFTERGKKLPDPQPVLEACYRTMLAHVAADAAIGERPLFIGGKSLGGRIASHVAAARDAAESDANTWWDRLHGLVCLGYPLHPPGKSQQVRVSHLPRLTHPMLIVQGAKDGFGTPEELHAFFDVLSMPSQICVVEHGNHSLEVPKRSGIPQAQVFARALDWIEEWILGVIADKDRRV